MVHGEPYLDRYFCPCYNGGNRGFKGVNFPEDLKSTLTKHIVKTDTAEKIKTTMFFLLCFFFLIFLVIISIIYLQSFCTRVNITHNN
jgi:preprotein translocase subunit SecY